MKIELTDEDVLIDLSTKKKFSQKNNRFLKKKTINFSKKNNQFLQKKKIDFSKKKIDFSTKKIELTNEDVLIDHLIVSIYRDGLPIIASPDHLVPGKDGTVLFHLQRHACEL